MNIEYFLFNIFVILGPFISRFFYRKTILPKIRPALIAISISAFLFIVFDEFVTGLFWYFNPKYILNIYLINLPFEEILFFITVPYSCLVIWENWRKIIKDKVEIKKIYILLFFLSIFTLSFFFYINGMLYSSSVLSILIIVISIEFIFKTGVFSKLSFLIYIFAINMLTFIFNLYLTARPIVIYNPSFKTGLQIITIPFEDFIFGIALITMVIILYEKMMNNSKKAS